MKTLKTINFNENKIVLNQVHVESDILPSTAKELGRDISVDGETLISGAVYAKNFYVNQGSLKVEGPVFAQGELHLKADLSQPVEFRKAVGCSGTLAGLMTKARVQFLGDVSAKKVSLRGAFVAGSIMAEEIDLDGCVVLGGVFATKRLSLKNVVAGTFHGPEILLSEGIYLLFPAAFAVEPISAGPGLTIKNLVMADLGALYFGKGQKPRTGFVPMDLKVDVVNYQLSDSQENKQVLRSLSVAGKIMMADLADFDSIYNHFILRTGTMAGHLAKSFNLPEGELNPGKVAELFFGILSGQTEVQEFRDFVTMEELRQKYL